MSASHASSIKETLLIVEHDKIKHLFYLRADTKDVLVFEQVFVKKEYRFTAHKSPRIIIDAGAHIGLASVYFANLFPEAKIIALEPDHANFEMLKKNTQAYENITALNAALWNKNEALNLMDSEEGNWAYTTTPIQSNEEKAIRNTVHALTIDYLIAQYQLKQIDILKIDIEGAEKEVFQDSTSWIHKVDAIIIELHEHMKSGANRSFYHGSNGFELEWKRGENIYLSRKDCISPVI